MNFKDKKMWITIGATVLACIILSILIVQPIIKYEEKDAFCQGLCLVGESSKMSYDSSANVCSCYKKTGSLEPFYELDLEDVFPPFS